jgi:hypothetical protein
VNASSTIDLLATTFDTNVVPRATMLALYNERYRQAVADSLWRTTEYAIGTTTSGTSRYAVPDEIVDLRQVYLGTYTAPAVYDVVSQDQILALRDSNVNAFLRGDGAGVFAQGFDSSAGAFIDLEPAPDVTGTAIVGVAPTLPTALTDTTNAAGTPGIPADFHMGLYYGVKADLYLLQDDREDLAQPNEARFQDMVGKLAGRKNTRFGSGTRSVAVAVGGR